MRDVPVLVVGTGLIGSMIARELQQHGARVACADLDAGRAQRAGAEIGCPAMQLNITDAESVASTIMDMRPVLAVHAAGRFRARTPGEAHALILDSAHGAANLAAGAAAARVSRLLLVSSVAVYTQHRGPLAETSRTGGRSPYGLAKSAAEAMLLDRCAGTATTPLIARLAGVYGAPARPDGGWLNSTLDGLLRTALRTKEAWIPAFLGGHDYLHVRDAADGICRVAEFGRTGAYNIGGGAPVEVADVASAFATLGAAVRFHDEDSTGYRWWLDTTRARSELGFEARTTLTDGMRRWADQICHEELCQ